MASLSPSDTDEIIELCERHEAAHRPSDSYHRCVELRSWFIKYDNHKFLYPEYKTQEYISSQASGNPSAPRIPRIVDYFVAKQRWGYLVTERIEDKTPADTAPEAVAKALQWLRDVPAPPGLVFGPVGGGRARHKLFKDFKAPLQFSSTKALQNYMNRALLIIGPDYRPAEVDFLDDPLIFTQSDMDSSNFALDRDKRVCMFDFAEVGILPESFASYTLADVSDPFVSSVAKYVGWTNDRNRGSLARALGIIWMIADPTLGLDSDGNDKARS